MNQTNSYENTMQAVGAVRRAALLAAVGGNCETKSRRNTASDGECRHHRTSATATARMARRAFAAATALAVVAAASAASALTDAALGPGSRLLDALAWHESRFDDKAVGPAGERGLFQITAGAVIDLNVALDEAAYDLADRDDPTRAACIAAEYLALVAHRYSAKTGVPVKDITTETAVRLWNRPADPWGESAGRYWTAFQKSLGEWIAAGAPPRPFDWSGVPDRLRAGEPTPDDLYGPGFISLEEAAGATRPGKGGRSATIAAVTDPAVLATALGMCVAGTIVGLCFIKQQPKGG